MFQNLLYHTDPSLKEYEKTAEMVEEIEGVMRALEDEKVGEEEREGTRDIWGRIAGLDGDKVSCLDFFFLRIEQSILTFANRCC